ncbi:MAG: peptidase, partial [Phycisphaerae bacterium SM23_33]
RRLAGSQGESVVQPEWSPAGELLFISDRSNWWNLYRPTTGKPKAVVQMEAEFAGPMWALRPSTYAFAAGGKVICAYRRHGTDHLAQIDLDSGALEEIETPYNAISYIRVADGAAWLVAGSPTLSAAVVRIDLKTRRMQVVRRADSAPIDPGYISVAEPIEFPTSGDRTAHALFYRPRNRDFRGPKRQKPPLLVMSHGGPTAATTAALRLKTQYYTSRGFAVVDVNYGGSTGYGRDYRRRLYGQWGVVDVDDCVNAALHLARIGQADPQRLALTGGSAGGYTTLAALTFRDVFAAGSSHFGISDCEALARETHKLESHYLDTLIGPYPRRRDLYVERSPIHHVGRLSCPVIFFQGLDDKVVPPNQAERMVQALREKGIPVAYVAFEGEQHGFRRAESIQRALEAELYFFSKAFRFELPEPVQSIDIENLQSR